MLGYGGPLFRAAWLSRCSLVSAQGWGIPSKPFSPCEAIDLLIGVLPRDEGGRFSLEGLVQLVWMCMLGLTATGCVRVFKLGQQVSQDSRHLAFLRSWIFPPSSENENEAATGVQEWQEEWKACWQAYSTSHIEAS